jgi:hypothetical protein
MNDIHNIFIQEYGLIVRASKPTDSDGIQTLCKFKKKCFGLSTVVDYYRCYRHTP